MGWLFDPVVLGITGAIIGAVAFIILVGPIGWPGLAAALIYGGIGIIVGGGLGALIGNMNLTIGRLNGENIAMQQRLDEIEQEDIVKVVQFSVKDQYVTAECKNGSGRRIWSEQYEQEDPLNTQEMVNDIQEQVTLAQEIDLIFCKPFSPIARDGLLKEFRLADRRVKEAEKEANTP